MYKQGNIIEDGFKGIAQGVKIATDTVRQTMGPKGINVALEMDEFPFFGCTNDGATIIEKIELDESDQKIGLNAIKEAVMRSNANSGDGSTTTCVLLDAILQEALNSGIYDGIKLKNELDTYLPIILKKIDEKKREITIQNVRSVAIVAGESESLGDLLQEIYEKIGKGGIISLEGSGTYDTSYKFIDGVRFARTGFLSSHFITEGENNKAIYEKPVILITKRKIERDSDIETILEYIIKNNRPLIVFTDDMDSAVASRMVATYRAKVAKICIIKAPVMWKNSIFEDFAKCTGATVLEDATGVNYKNLALEHLGTCDKIVVDKDETVLIGIKDISEHISYLRTQTDDESKLRLSWLTTKTALLKLGALSETDLFYKRLKCEDAIYSCRLALEDGVVDGGGICLNEIAEEIDHPILKEALQAPYKQILSTGITNIDITKVIDSSGIVKGAVKNAIGIASTLLTIGTVITKPLKSPEQIAYELLQNKGMRM